jgi:uncharacterized membrane protein
MNRKPGAYASLAILLVMGAVAVWGWAQIPADKPIAVHWSASGVPNGYASKFWALVGLPLLTAAIAAVLAIIPSLEPRARNLAMSGEAYQAIWIGVLVLMAAVYVALVLNATGHPVQIKMIVPIAVGALFIVIGNYLGKTRSTFFFGIRTPWTLSSELSWTTTHRLAARLFVVCGFLVVLVSVLAPGTTAAFVLVSGIACAVVIPVLYSYKVWRSDPNRRESPSLSRN